MRDLSKYAKCLIALGCSLLLLCGCGVGSPAESLQVETQTIQTAVETSVQVQEELTSDNTEILKAATAEFIASAGAQEERRLVTIDISAFDRSAEDYKKWVQENYADEKTLILVFTEMNEVLRTLDAAEEYMERNGYEVYQDMSTGCDWTAIQIKRVAEEETKQTSEVLSVDISYPILSGGKGLEVQMEYINGTWEVARFKMMYVE